MSTYADRPSNVVLSVLCLWGTTKAFWKYMLAVLLDIFLV
jgi:hypothetical protein